MTLAEHVVDVPADDAKVRRHRVGARRATVREEYLVDVVAESHARVDGEPRHVLRRVHTSLQLAHRIGERLELVRRRSEIVADLGRVRNVVDLPEALRQIRVGRRVERNIVRLADLEQRPVAATHQYVRRVVDGARRLRHTLDRQVHAARLDLRLGQIHIAHFGINRITRKYTILNQCVFCMHVSEMNDRNKKKTTTTKTKSKSKNKIFTCR